MITTFQTIFNFSLLYAATELPSIVNYNINTSTNDYIVNVNSPVTIDNPYYIRIDSGGTLQVYSSKILTNQGYIQALSGGELINYVAQEDIKKH